ncbi:DUF4326 domain-containing protein [Cypionkella sinensis]|uniref:DUF4326 domain-containing protein n=1 Tax=Cypionkella sinensis TaxID=1756043 RepID=A0ABV7IVJ3_9RHOB
MTPRRITLFRTKGWRKPEGAIIVSRGKGRIYGNPWLVGNPGGLEAPSTWYNLDAPLSQAEAVVLYGLWLTGSDVWQLRMPDQAMFTEIGKRDLTDHFYGRRQLILANFETLRGHDLCCWCKPGQPCHADVLLEMANK